MHVVFKPHTSSQIRKGAHMQEVLSSPLITLKQITDISNNEYNNDK